MTELVLLVLLVAGSVAAQHHGGTPWVAGYWTVIGVLLAAPWSRRWLLRRITNARVRRKVRRALGHADIQGRPHRVTATPVGYLVRVAIAPGGSQEKVTAASSKLKTALNVRAVEVIPDPDNGRFVTLNITDRDPFAVKIIPWPHQDVDELSIWDPIPLGPDQYGHQVDLQLVNPDQGARSILIAGETGSGKTRALALIFTTALRARDVKRTWIADGGELDTAALRDHIHAWVGADRSHLHEMLTAVLEAMDERKDELLAEGKVHVMPGDPCDLIIIDEAPFFFTAPPKDKIEAAIAKANHMMATDVARRGRKYGFILAVIAQKPTTDSIPSSLTSQLTYRLAFRLTKTGVVAALGQDRVTDGWDTTKVRPDQQGVGILDAQGALPTWLKVFFLPPNTAIRARPGTRVGWAAASAAKAHPGPQDRANAAKGRASGPGGGRSPADAPAAAGEPGVPAAGPAAGPAARLRLVGGATSGGPAGAGDTRSVVAGPVAPRGVARAGGALRAMQARVLERLAGAAGPLSRHALAGELGVDPSHGTLRRALAALERDGLVGRDRDGYSASAGGAGGLARAPDAIQAIQESPDS
jgi:hypothetical protein